MNYGKRAPVSPADSAADSILNKASKLEIAREAILTQDLQALGVADRLKVKRLEDKLLFGGKATQEARDDVGDIIVCDDYSANRSGKAPALALAAATLLAGAAGTAYLVHKPEPVGQPATPAAKRAEYDAVTRELQPDGSWKEIKRERLKP